MNIDRTLRLLSATIPVLHADIAMHKRHKAHAWSLAEKGKPESEPHFRAFCAHKKQLQRLRKELRATNELICFLKKQRKTPKKEG